MFFPLAMLSQYIFGPALFLISVFIVLIILLQRGRGGGLTGALGGAGGASAFGVKAGDIFTRITAVSVLFWIVLCVTTCYWYLLPEKLDIATTPSSMSGEKSGGSGMGGMVGGDLPPTPQELKDLLSNPSPGAPASSESATPPPSALPSDAPPAPNIPAPNIKDIPASVPAEASSPATTTTPVDPASLPVAPLGTPKL